MRSRVRWLGVMGSATLVVALSLALTGASSGVFRWALPAWVPLPIVPADNPMTREKVALGRHLFYDTRLSADGSMSCASCHLQSQAFSDPRAQSIGITGESSPLNALSLANVAYSPTLTWANPLMQQLEVQALVPIFGEHPVEMGMAGKEALLFERLRCDPAYQRLFASAFPNEAREGPASLFSIRTVTQALASFQRTLLSFDSAYDRYKYGGQPQAISEAAKRGEALFFGEKLECYHCHGGLNFTDNQQHQRMPIAERGFHNTGLYNVDGRGAYPPGHEGLAEFTGLPADVGRFRTPSLRNVRLTAPYMHDGSLPDLVSVIRQHYAEGGRAGGGPNPRRSPFIQGFEISDQEVSDLIAFLDSLTDDAFVRNRAHADPWPEASRRIMAGCRDVTATHILQRSDRPAAPDAPGRKTQPQ
jgi:cytochrome c peroxidase